MNRRQALSVMALIPTCLGGTNSSFGAGSDSATAMPTTSASAPAQSLSLSINTASASDWSASMSRVDLLPTFVDSPQSATQQPAKQEE